MRIGACVASITQVALLWNLLIGRGMAGAQHILQLGADNPNPERDGRVDEQRSHRDLQEDEYLVYDLYHDGSNATSSNSTSTSSESDSSNPTAATVVQVNCSSTLRAFVATTDLVLSGRTSLLSLLERKVLKGEFMTIYNTLTTENCDSYHRKLNVLDFVEQTNMEGELYTFEEMQATNQTLQANESRLIEEWFNPATRTRNLQVRPTQEEDSTLKNSTEEEITVTYQITGTCRDCPVSRTGSFQLYDDSFRRALGQQEGVQVQIRTQLLHIRDLQDDQDDKSDCVCVQGVEPTPQAPGVQECVDLMNERLPMVQQEIGILQDLALETLLQLDDLSLPHDEDEIALLEDQEDHNGQALDEEPADTTTSGEPNEEEEEGGEDSGPIFQDDPEVTVFRGSGAPPPSDMDAGEWKIWARRGNNRRLSLRKGRSS